MSTFISSIFRRFLRKPNVSEASDQFGKCVYSIINFINNKSVKTKRRQHKMKQSLFSKVGKKIENIRRTSI